MEPPKLLKSNPISIKAHPALDERWVQAQIAEDPLLLGLGDVYLKDKERIQPKAGRLDLLLQDTDGNRRYEVEVQLGATDEAHIIRTVEYWDLERKRYPQYEHCAVIVAEEITARFLNVIHLFNGQIPLIALQMKAFEVSGGVTLIFTKVIDELRRGPVDEDEDMVEPADRKYWEERRPAPILGIVDQLLDLIRGFAPEFDLNYAKGYIGLQRHGGVENFATFAPKKKHCVLAFRCQESEDIESEIESSGLELIGRTRWGAYRVRLEPSDVQRHRALITKWLKTAFDEWNQ